VNIAFASRASKTAPAGPSSELGNDSSSLRGCELDRIELGEVAERPAGAGEITDGPGDDEIQLLRPVSSEVVHPVIKPEHHLPCSDLVPEDRLLT